MVGLDEPVVAVGVLLFLKDVYKRQNKGSRFTIRFPHAGAMETPAEYSRANPAGKPVPAPASQPIAEPVA